MAASRPQKRPWYYRLPRRLRLHLVFLRQRWPYYLRLTLLSPIELATLLFFKISHILLTRGWHSGIRLVGTHFGEGENQVFVDCTKDALDLIQKYDPHRFRRILREVRIIDNCPLTSAGRYNRQSRSCEIDFPHYRDTTGGYLHTRHRGTDEYQRSLALYAASLIHEATHGKFDSHGILYTAKNRLRIERLCHQEEARFYARLEQSNPDIFVEIGTLLQPFQEEYYQRYWQQSRWEFARRELARIRESWRDFGAQEQHLEKENRQDTVGSPQQTTSVRSSLRERRRPSGRE